MRLIQKFTLMCMAATAVTAAVTKPRRSLEPARPTHQHIDSYLPPKELKPPCDCRNYLPPDNEIRHNAFENEETVEDIHGIKEDENEETSQPIKAPIHTEVEDSQQSEAPVDTVIIDSQPDEAPVDTVIVDSQPNVAKDNTEPSGYLPPHIPSNSVNIPEAPEELRSETIQPEDETVNNVSEPEVTSEAETPDEDTNGYIPPLKHEDEALIADIQAEISADNNARNGQIQDQDDANVREQTLPVKEESISEKTDIIKDGLAPQNERTVLASPTKKEGYFYPKPSKPFLLPSKKRNLPEVAAERNVRSPRKTRLNLLTNPEDGPVRISTAPFTIKVQNNASPMPKVRRSQNQNQQ